MSAQPSGHPQSPPPLEHLFDLDSPAIETEVETFRNTVRKEMQRCKASHFLTAVDTEGRKRRVTVLFCFGGPGAPVIEKAPTGDRVSQAPVPKVASAQKPMTKTGMAMTPPKTPKKRPS